MLRRHESILHPSDDPKLELPRRTFWIAFAVVSVFACVLQMTLFSIDWYAALIAVGLAFALAIVAGRVAGETGIAPIGAMGKITQFTFALITPGNPTANLMAANVTGGSASQCADLLHDLKTGRLLGAWPRHQAVAQMFGVASGALMGSAGYLLLVPDPSATLLTPEWPAPAVAQWKAVAEVFTQGVSHLPKGSGTAAMFAVFAGILLSVAESKLPPPKRRFVPNPASIGLALVIPAYYSVSVFLGALLLWFGQRHAAGFTKRFGIVIAAGLIAGESLVGVLFAIARLLGN
jgi:OPT family oligopeptide transporter